MMEQKVLSNYDEHFRLRLCIARLSFLRFDEKCLLESKLQTTDNFLTLSLDELSISIGRRLRTTLWNPSHIVRLIDIDLKLMQSYSAKVLFYDSPDYPYLVRQIFDPPYALFCRGNIFSLNNPSVAIVGTRKPSAQNAHATKKIAQDITVAGITIVSGLAFGVDASAHMGSLLAQGSELCGTTIAVLGSGVDNITPSSNKRLAASILASGGCIVSEYQLGSEVKNWQFVQRNRIISALSRVVLVMEAPPGSGALHTADFAIEHNRELCFYANAVSTVQSPRAIVQGDLFGGSLSQKKCVNDYVEDGAAVINDASDVLQLVNSMTFLEERALSF